MTDVEHEVPSTPRTVRKPRWYKRVPTVVALVAVSLSAVAVVPNVADASNLSNARTKAEVILRQINRINAEVGRLGQKYDEAQIKLHRLNNQIKNTRAVVAAIKAHVTQNNRQLRADVIFAYVTNGSNEGNNPLFSKDASKTGATNVYTQLAEGNINATIAGLKSYRIQLIQQRGLLRAEDANARAVTRDAAHSFNTSRVLQAKLNNTLAQVKGQIANYISQAQAAANAASVAQLNSASGTDGITDPPPDSRANVAIDAAMSYIGVPYVWGGASRSGVDCSGLIMLAYEAAGIDFPHYSGAMYQDTARVPLVDIEPGDLLFYGYGGDEHVAMYVGGGKMIEAEETGTLVHIVPIRLGYGFVGLGRPRA